MATVAAHREGVSDGMQLSNARKLRLLGGAVGTCLAAAIGVSAVVAQEATPTPSASATPSATTEQPPQPGFGGTAEEKTALAEAVQKVSDTITAVQKDRDAAAGKTDLGTVDALLAQAGKLRDQAKASLQTDDVSKAPRQLLVANQAAMAAEALIRAQLTDYGLPSQQAGVSRTLVAAFNEIDEVTGRTASTTDQDAASLVTTAQALYKAAYDLYNAGTYAQAAGTAEVAARVARLADVLTSDVVTVPGPGAGVEGGPPKGRRGDGFGPVQVVPGVEIGPGGPGPDANAPSRSIVIEGPRVEIGGAGGLDDAGGDFSSETPLEVPAPNFD
jgi:TolA-binding protein